MTTTLDSIALDLPEPMELVDEISATEVVSTLEERRWLGEDGLYVALSILQSDKSPELDELALDETVGATLYRYVDDLEGVIEGEFAVDVAGAAAARAARLRITSDGGEPLAILLVAAVSHDHHVVILQVSWTEALTERFLPIAMTIGRSLSISPTAAVEGRP